MIHDSTVSSNISKNEDSEQTTKTGQLSSNLTKRERMIEAYQKQA